MVATGDKQRGLDQLFEELKRRYDDYRCVKCKNQPWPAWGGHTHVLRCSCGVEAWPNLESSKNWMKEKLADMIERQTGGGAIVIYNEETALARVQEAKAGGLFPQNATQPQMLMLAKAAVAYGLDPLFGELTLYQGKPYITIDGRRRLDADAGHHPSIRFRPLTADEVRYYWELDALKPRDVPIICVGVDDYGAESEAIGILLAHERDGNANTPQVQRPIEMSQKRAEMRWRKMAYGPHPLPDSVKDLMSTAEEFVEGSSRELDSTPIAAPASATRQPAPATEPKPKAHPQQTKRPPKNQDPDKFCQEHGRAWAVGEGGVLGHPIEGGGWHDKPSTPQDDPGAPEQETAAGGGGEPDKSRDDREPPQSMAGLQVRLERRDVNWDGFQARYLKMPWEEWAKLNGPTAVAMAWTRYLELEGAAELEKELLGQR